MISTAHNQGPSAGDAQTRRTNTARGAVDRTVRPRCRRVCLRVRCLVGELVEPDTKALVTAKEAVAKEEEKHER